MAFRRARSASLTVFVSWIAACASGARPQVQSPIFPPTPARAAVSAQLPATRVVTPVQVVEASADKGALPPLSAAWGTADPVTFVAAAPDRRWVAVCQARSDTNRDGVVRVDVSADGAVSGDELAGYLLDAPGPGTPIDAFVGSDPSGRFVSFVREGRVFLRDTTTRVDAELAADPRDDLEPFVHPRAVAFDPTGKRLLYVQKPELGSKVVVRDLATGSETVVDPGQGLLFRVEFDPAGDALVLRVVVADTNGNGRLDWPVREAPKPWMRCAAPLPRFALWERPGDDVTLRVARASGGVARDVPGLVVPMGDAVVVREPDATLVRADLGGKRALIARKGCEARLLHVDAARGLALVTCLDARGRMEAVLVGQGPAKPLGLTLSAAPGDHWLEGAPRLVPLHPGSDAALLDLDRREVEMLESGDRILATSGARALLLRGRSLVLHELGGEEREVGTEPFVPLAHVAHAGSVFFVPPFIIDVARGALLGTAQERALAVSIDGTVLVSEGGGADATHFARGPLLWKAPNADVSAGQARALR